MNLSIPLILTCFLTLNSIHPKNNLYSDIDSQPSKQVDIYESKQSLIEFIRLFFQEQYAPFDWKKKYLNWDWSKHVDQAKELITKTTSTSDFHKILKRLIHSTKDPHVEIVFTNGIQMDLPINIIAIDQRLMITESSDKSSILEPKDEILTINGEKGIDVYKRFLVEDFGSENNILKSYQIKHPRFTHRKESRADNMPISSLWTLEIKKPNNKIYKTSVFWEKTLEQQDSETDQNGENTSMQKTSIFSPILEKKSENLISQFYNNGHKSFIPTIGKVIHHFSCEKSDGLSGYISYIDKTKIAFLRINSYSTLNLKKLESIIKQIENETEALILDLTNNPGGYLEYGMMSLSLLSNKTLLMPKFIIKIDHEILKDAEEKLKYLNQNNSINLIEETLPNFIWENMSHIEKLDLSEKMKDFYKDIVEKWNSGIFTTGKKHYLGIEKIFPNKSGYSKPILMVINESTSSCTEFVAATLQDNKRAFSIGSETSGAGGFVKECFLTNIHGVTKWTTTSSVLFRSNGIPIEYFGIQPDITYNVSWKDLENNFFEMKKKIESAIYNILIFGKIHFGVK